jgi:hypothetical protein
LGNFVGEIEVKWIDELDHIWGVMAEKRHHVLVLFSP